MAPWADLYYYSNMSLEIATQKYTEYKKLIDQDIALVSRRLQKQTEETYGQYSGDIMKEYLSLLERGGKRIRGVLAMQAYFMAGGDDSHVAVRAATCMEMLQAYWLTTDDIIDQSRIRRGSPTVQVALEQYHQQHRFKYDAAHFGKCQAMTIAQAGMHLALLEIGRLSLNDSNKLYAMNLINEAMVTTAHGQINDLMNEVANYVDEADVLQVLTWKTAYYTTISPLALGFALAGKSLDENNWLYNYARHLGLYFQLTDDIIGLYGRADQAGKSNLDDLREGKMTLLMARALDNASDEQKQQLLSILGRPDVTEADRKTAAGIVEDTGAYAYVSEFAAHEGQLALEALDEADDAWGSDVPFLRGLVEYIRQSIVVE